ncbi:MAG: 4Fe-4S binding protein [Patescibacteria group bacterium]|nr:4Fe-4S binding protein [Patescibacteria group bacterium]
MGYNQSQKLKSWKDIPPAGLILSPGNSRENKTGSWSNKKPFFDDKKCTQCQLCVNACPEAAINSGKDKKISVNPDYCKGCAACVEACPRKAIKLN